MSVDELVAKGQKAVRSFNYDKALTYYKQAAGKGSMAAVYYLGMLYSNDNFDGKSLSTARSYFKQAAEAGIPDAQYELGKLCSQGRGGAKNLVEAARWWKAAAAQGHTQAANALKTL